MEHPHDYALRMDKQYGLAARQTAYVFPQHKAQQALYFLGNSLGLPAREAQQVVYKITDEWAAHGVEGFFAAQPPWWDLETEAAAQLTPWLGAQPEEVAVLNSLTVNLHFLFLHFYKPTPQRFKIIVEEKAFPSDQYLVQSQLEFHGLTPEVALIEVPRKGHGWSTQDFLEVIEREGDTVALVFLGGVNYYNGQLLDLSTIAAAAQQQGALFGLDLAHAIGNVPLALHAWQVDFAAWCSYKYLNGGPGSIGGLFIHDKHLDKQGPALKGWWGVPKDKRFLMDPQFTAGASAAAWHQSTPSILALAPLLAALKVRNRLDPQAFFDEQKMLTDFLKQQLMPLTQQVNAPFEIITPSRHGAQLTLIFREKGKMIFDHLQAQGVYVDWREPNAIRLAPTALYNTFEEVYLLGQILAETLDHCLGRA